MSHPEVLAKRYELGESVGRGGMADVYRATDRLLGRPVAVKVLRDRTGDETDKKRFAAETRMLAGLNHPGLVMVLDAGITRERPFLVMELVEGPTLGALQAGQPLEPERVRILGAQLADALVYIHEQGVIHRDVKPGNVLIGAADQVKLADFGIARLVGDTVRHTQTGQAIGTAAYLSPEQVRGDELTPSTDIYALGLVLLEALTGIRAFPGSPTEAALARLHRSPHLPEELPAHWRALLASMTAQEPVQRPTAADVASRLRALANTESPVTTPAPTRTLVLGQPTPAPARGTGAGHTSLIDRVGDAVARQPAAAMAAARRLPPHLRPVVGVVAAILLLILIAGIASSSGSDRSPDPVGGRPSSSRSASPPPSPQATTSDAAPPSVTQSVPTATPPPTAHPHHHKGKGKGKGKGKDRGKDGSI